jgi:hypothetical protein
MSKKRSIAFTIVGRNLYLDIAIFLRFGLKEKIALRSSLFLNGQVSRAYR